MDQTKQSHGNFVAFMNRNKQPGDKKPAFEGTISVPDANGEHRLALWAREYLTASGEVRTMFYGSADAVSPSDEPMEQVTNLIWKAENDAAAMLGNLSLKPRQLVLFPNGFKDDEPDKNRPDFWGGFNPGKNQPIVRVSAWLRKDRYDRAMISGATSYPIPGKSEKEQQDTSPAPDLVKATTPNKSRSRSAKEGRA